MISIMNLTKRFGRKTAVDNVSFSLKKGDIMGFIGPNGAGKSTTMRMITGCLTPTSGQIKIGKYDILKEPMQAKSLIGYLPENAPLYANKTVKEFLDFAGELRGFHGHEKRIRVEKAIETCFLESVKNQVIDTLSKGYKQRTCFAQALLHDPEILILDEPTDGLDPNQKMEVRKLIKNMREEKAIIISTHILEEVEAVTSKVVLISSGKKRFDGTPEEFANKASGMNTFEFELLSIELDPTIKILNAMKTLKDIKVKESSSNRTLFELSLYDISESDKFKMELSEQIGFNKWNVGLLKQNSGKLTEVFAKFTSENTNDKEMINEE